MFSPSAFPQQADLLLPWEWADGCEARSVQSPLLDLEQLVGGAEDGQTHSCFSSDVHHDTFPPLRLVKHSLSLLALSGKKRGSSACCWVYQSVMNINEANLYPSSASLLVCSNSSGDLLLLHLHPVICQSQRKEDWKVQISLSVNTSRCWWFNVWGKMLNPKRPVWLLLPHLFLPVKHVLPQWLWLSCDSVCFMPHRSLKLLSPSGPLNQ